MKNYEKHLEYILRSAAWGACCFDCPARDTCPEYTKQNAEDTREKGTCREHFIDWAKKEVK